MNSLTTDQLVRYSKVLLMAYISFFGLLVMYSNFTDYPSNYEYVGHILSMDTTQINENIRYRAITSPMLHHRIYWLIITLEVIYTVCCLLGTYHLYRKINAPAEAFHDAKKTFDHWFIDRHVRLLRRPANYWCGMVRHGHFANMECQGLGPAHCRFYISVIDLHRHKS